MSEEDMIRLEAERLANQLLSIAASLVALGDAGTIYRMSDELGGWARSRAERAEVTALFGAMSGYPDDVVVDDGSENGLRVECKYRSNGVGFKRLYDWIAGADVLVVHGKEIKLTVCRLDRWCDSIIDDAKDKPNIVAKISSSTFARLRNWICESHVLAVRMPHSPWLVIKIEEGEQ